MKKKSLLSIFVLLSVLSLSACKFEFDFLNFSRNNSSQDEPTNSNGYSQSKSSVTSKNNSSFSSSSSSKVETVDSVTNSDGYIVSNSTFVKGTTLITTPVTDETIRNADIKRISESFHGPVFAVVDISLKLDDKTVQPSENVKVSIPLTAFDFDLTMPYTVFYLTKDSYFVQGGTYEENALTFRANELYTFIITSQTSTFTVSYKYVTFNANGGTGSMSRREVIRNTFYTLPQCGFSAPSGSKFSHWEVNDVIKHPGDRLLVNADTTVKAIWIKL